MVPQGTTRDVARIVDYQRFYKPEIGEFITGFAFEYVQLSFKQLLIHLPDIDSEGKKPGCIYYNSWRKEVWGNPGCVFKLSHIKQLMKSNKIRSKKKLPTSYFKELLERHALSFTWKGLHIVVFPKKVIQHENVEILDNHNVYVNGVEQAVLRGKQDSKLYKRWFNSGADSLKLDWRYLLGLDNPEISGTNVLYSFFEGVYTKNESVFKNIGVNFTTGGPENPPSIKEVHPPGFYSIRKQHIKETKYANVVNAMKPDKYKTKSEDELSGHVLEARELAKVKRIERTIRTEIAAANKAYKEAERFLADDVNREKMAMQTMICIQNKKTKEVLRLTYWKATKLVYSDEWTFVEKYMWKTQLRKEREKRKEETEKNRVAPSGVSRKQIRQNSRPKKRREKTQFGKFQHIKGKYETDDEGNIVQETVTIITPTREYEFIPIMKKIWKETFNKMTGRKIIELVKEIPWMIPAYDADGNKVLKQATKRIVKKGKPYISDISQPKVKHGSCTIFQHNFKSKKSAYVKPKKQVEISEHASSGPNKGSKQESKSVEKVRGDDKRVKTPNIKH